MKREVLNFDIIVIGGGPSGLSAAIQLKKLSAKSDISIAVIEKGSSIGSHILSGCVLDTKGIDELIPEWKDLNFPIQNRVDSEKLLFLTKNCNYSIPIPTEWKNNNNYVISLGELCISLANYATNLGIDIFAGFSAKSVIIENSQVCGVVIGGDGSKDTTTVEILAKQTIVAEGCRGSIAKQINEYFELSKNCTPQTYGLGIKELWFIDSDLQDIPDVTHTIGYPLYNKSYGGGFLYKYNKKYVALGLVSALDYKNPYFNPYEEFQLLKQHNYFKKILLKGKRISYGARTVVEGGIQSLPKLSFPGGVLVGDSAGFLNVPKVKGVHNAIKSGMLAAEAIHFSLLNQQLEAKKYSSLFKSSWIYKELYKVRNIRPSFKLGLYGGLFYSLVDYYIFKGLAPWTFKIKKGDNKSLNPAIKYKKIIYPKHDNKISFDITDSLEFSNIISEENQYNHISIKNSAEIISVNFKYYANPETRYCPADVYKIINENTSNPVLNISYKNCIHCKACDIKDPNSNIVWNAPENGNGPQFSEM